MKVHLPKKSLPFLVVLLVTSLVVAPVIADHTDDYTIGEDNIHHDRDADYKTDYPTHSENPTGEPVIDIPTTRASVEDPSTERDYELDYEIPDNGLRAFYSADVEEEPNYDEDENDIEPSDPPTDDIRSIDEIVESGQNQDPESWTRLVDMPYLTSQSIVAFRDFRLADYRRHQIVGTDFKMNESLVLEDYKGEEQSSGVIKNAYIAIVGIDAAAKPRFTKSGNGGSDGPNCDDDEDEPNTGPGPCDGGTLSSSDNGEWPLFAGTNGEVYSYLDFEVDESELPEVEVDEIDETDETQTQTARTYHIENMSVTRNGTIIGDEENVSFGERDGAAGIGMEYADGVNRNATFLIVGNVSANITEYHWERSRQRIEDSREDVTVTGSTQETGTISGSCHSPNSTCTISGSDSVSGTVDKTATKTFSELGGDRQVTVDKDVSFDVSGTISGSCTITGSGSCSISGSISGSEEFTFEYEYWDHWDSAENTDRGGWEFQHKEFVREDSLQFQDTQDALITDNNRMDVEQVSIEVQPDRYHNVIQMNYVGEETNIVRGENITEEQFEETYLWSLLLFGEHTYVETDLKTYSITEYDKAFKPREVDNNCNRGGCNEYSVVDFPRQLSAHMFSQVSGPQVTSTGLDNNFNPELHGWRGDYINVGDKGPHEDVSFETGKPIAYHTFIVKNAPSPATSVISIHGTERPIREYETKEVPYVEPDVTIEYVSENGESDTENEYRIRVTGVDGEPLQGKNLRISGANTNVQTTNYQGEVYITVDDGVSHIQVEVPSDDITAVIQEDQDYYYGGVTAERTVRRSGLVGHLYDIVYQLLFAIPLILLYLLWRDYELGI